MSKTDYKSQFDLSGKVAVVTGGAGMLGREFSLGLTQQGASVAVLDIDIDKAASVCAEIESTGANALAVQVDVADTASVQKAIENVVDQLEGIDILINNAQSATRDPAAYFAPFEQYDFDEWRRVISVDLEGMAIMAQHVCAQMLRQNRGGSLIQIGSVYGEFGPDNRIYDGADYKGIPINNPAVYSVGKAGALGLTRWLATSYAHAEIRVNAVVPGGVESGQSDNFVRQYANRVPLGRMANKDEIVGTILWLASPASSYVTGQHIYVDGGLSAW